jgi:hypothetical protein
MIDVLCWTFRWGAEEYHEKSYVMIYDVLDDILGIVLPNTALESYMSFETICSRTQL